jgi:hypothetical protein
MGGGEPIPHDDFMTFGNNDPNHPNYIDFYDYKWGTDWDSGADGIPGTADAGEDNGQLDDAEKQHLSGNYFNLNRWKIFHYCIMCHECWAISDGDWTEHRAGRGEGSPPDNGDDDFTITKRATKVQNTFMHELGRNLGLPSTNNKNTVMYTTSAEAKKLDYLDSEWAIIQLDGITRATD